MKTHHSSINNFNSLNLNENVIQIKKNWCNPAKKSYKLKSFCDYFGCNYYEENS